jgi:hypothetical protein
MTAGISIAGSTFGAQLVLDYAFAFLLGVGFATAYPMNWVLVKTGIKDAM